MGVISSDTDTQLLETAYSGMIVSELFRIMS
jgi:hypothetical protein